MSVEVLAPAMFAAMAIALLLGFPVAFSVAAVGVLFGVVGVATGHFQPAFLLAGTMRIEAFFHNDNLLAIPLFVFMGMLLERTGLAADMLQTLDELLSDVRGGMAYTVVLVGASLAAITGFVSAAVIGLALIALPPMLRRGYDARLATGLVAASGTLAQILPPSLVLIVLAEQLEVPLMDIFQGALLPSALLVLLYLVYIFVTTQCWPQRVPTTTSGEHRRSLVQRSRAALVAAGFPIGLILLVLASVYFAVATPTEGGAVGVTGALALGLVRRKLDSRRLQQALMAAGVLCSGLLFLLFGASFFTLVFRGLDGQVWVESMFQHLPAGQLGFLVFINIAIFFIAFFLDFFEIAFIVLPLIAPIARKLGIDMTWLAVLLAVNLQTSFMHPPFGIALYNLRSVTPTAIPTSLIYRGAIPFLLLQLTLVALLIAVPSIVLRPPDALANTDNVEIPLPPAGYGEPAQE